MRRALLPLIVVMPLVACESSSEPKAALAPSSSGQALARRPRGGPALPPAPLLGDDRGVVAPATPVPRPAITVGDEGIAADPIGIPECDRYVAAMNVCFIPKLPPEAQDQTLGPMKQLRLVWKERAATANASGRKALSEECNAKMAAEASALKSKGCVP